MEDDVLIKLLSVDPQNYDDAPLEGIRRLLSRFSGKGHPPEESRWTQARLRVYAWARRNGGDQRLQGLLRNSNQSRPNIFDLAIRKPDVLYKTVVEVDERVTLEDYAEDPERRQTEAQAPESASPDAELVKGLSGETVRILQRPQEGQIRTQLQEICLMHGYTFPRHEALVGKIAKEIGFNHVSLSHELMPMIKLVPRATSACADAYLTPAIRKYIDGSRRGSQEALDPRA
ncbi:hypothetical protein BTJ68_14502 [Hortaea werneckii EXF-2000]|uniref:Hydantoinase/oxoprolinase N-terminal domain-containing protein n=1 Tax=Hortaea werneckii EXF-2000 TaxID=1157616 RepID=A0A1Z5SNN4_HORWE|nr:hypothetical protein BTJ68_14502 [Hortaea werneckii EXF-2000]